MLMDSETGCIMGQRFTRRKEGKCFGCRRLNWRNQQSFTDGAAVDLIIKSIYNFRERRKAKKSKPQKKREQSREVHSVR